MSESPLAAIWLVGWRISQEGWLKRSMFSAKNIRYWRNCFLSANTSLFLQRARRHHSYLQRTSLALVSYILPSCSPLMHRAHHHHQYYSFPPTPLHSPLPLSALPPGTHPFTTTSNLEMLNFAQYGSLARFGSTCPNVGGSSTRTDTPHPIDHFHKLETLLCSPIVWIG